MFGSLYYLSLFSPPKTLYYLLSLVQEILFNLVLLVLESFEPSDYQLEQETEKDERERESPCSDLLWRR